MSTDPLVDRIRRDLQPRTWRFWLLWTCGHFVLFVGALWYGWTHVAGGVFCAFGPSTAWYLKDEELKRAKLEMLDVLVTAGQLAAALTPKAPCRPPTVTAWVGHSDPGRVH